MEGKGVLEIVNGTSGTFPYSFGQVGIPIYSVNTTFLPAGEYYLIFADYSGLPANVIVRYATIPASSFASRFSESASAGFIGLLGSFLAFIGIILMVASLFMQGKKAEQQQMTEQVEKIYAEIEKKAGKRKRGARNDAKSRSKSS